MSTAYSIDRMQDRGPFFIDAGEQVYGGQVIGEHIRPDDLVINVCEAKKLYLGFDGRFARHHEQSAYGCIESLASSR